MATVPGGHRALILRFTLVRSRFLGSLGACLLAVMLATFAAPPSAEAQFNPSGRRPKPAVAKPGVKPKGNKPPRKPKGDKPPKERTEALIARYTKIVLDQPGAQFPLQRLAQLHRERDGSLDTLVASFEKRSTDGDFNALVALAGILRHDGQLERAITTYERAIAEKPKSAVALMALAHLLVDRGEKPSAKERFEQALPLLTEAAEREQTLRTLMGLALDLDRLDDATRFHAVLVKASQGSFFVRAELGRELVLRGKYEAAEAEYRDVVKSATGDNRVLAPALRDLGSAQAKLGKRDDAMKTLERALKVAGKQSGVRREIYQIIVEVYRADDRLRDLVAVIEREGAHDADRLRMLGGLYEEIGQVEKALATYRSALAKDPKDVGTRLKVVQLLQIQGEIDEAIREYEALIRAAPRNPDYVFQLSEALLQRGDRARALGHLQKLEARSADDDETLAALVDFYERVEEKERALAVLQKLAKAGASDPRHLVELGARYFAEGDKAKAVATWERIRVVVKSKARGHLALGEVYLEHDMPAEAVAAFREAAKAAPGHVRYRKALALALERAGSGASPEGGRRKVHDEARQMWEGLLAGAADDANLAREARTHIVTLWGLGGSLSTRVRPLERRLAAKPPDLEAGRLLAEVFIRLRRHRDAERVLARVVEHAPGDASSFIRLERVLVLEQKLAEAIAALEKLVKIEPKRAREYYQRMAQYAAESYDDDAAIRYAARAVELSPDDASGNQKLGEMYRRRQDVERAASQFRQAIAKNDRLFVVYFQLAELLIGKGEVDEADRLLRRVVRASPDEELVSQAARLAVQINLGRGTLESLEKELLPVALGNPQKPLYRQLLVEIYGAMAFPLVHQAKSQSKEEAAAARKELRRIGERAVKPLLDALGDERDAQQRTAIELLGHIENADASSALFAYATGNAEPELRARAMIAAGSLRDVGLIPRLSELVTPGGEARADESDPVQVAAAWGIANTRSPKARASLVAMSDASSPIIRALGILGLATFGDRRDAKRFASVAASPDAGPVARSAAAFALGELGAKAEADTLVQSAEASDETLRATSTMALARLGARSARQAVAEALVAGEKGVRAAGAEAAALLLTGRWGAPPSALGAPEGRVDVRALLANLGPSAFSADERARALVDLAPEIARAAASAVQSSPERARTIADALLARSEGPGFEPLTRDLSSATEANRVAAEKAADSIASAVVRPFVQLAAHPTARVRAGAIQFLASRAEPEAREAVRAALLDPDETVKRATIAAIGRARSVGALESFAKLLAPEHSWPVRLRAAEAIETLTADGPPSDAIITAVEKSATDDEYALVREASLRALARASVAAARPVLEHAIAKDVEPRVREAAREILKGLR